MSSDICLFEFEHLALPASKSGNDPWVCANLQTERGVHWILDLSTATSHVWRKVEWQVNTLSCKKDTCHWQCGDCTWQDARPTSLVGYEVPSVLPSRAFCKTLLSPNRSCETTLEGFTCYHFVNIIHSIQVSFSSVLFTKTQLFVESIINYI